MMRVQLPDEATAFAEVQQLFVKGKGSAADQVVLAVQDSCKRLLCPAMETEMRLESKKRADEAGIKVFADNLRELLLAAPLGQKAVMAIDPGIRTGCKVVILDRQGKLLHNDVVFPDRMEADSKEKLTRLREIFQSRGRRHRQRHRRPRDRSLSSALSACSASIPIVMVNESGASIYSASDVAREEFPDHDLTVRGAVSIGRRLMDPLAELVKLDPKSIGVGQYQHDVDQSALKRSLDDTVVSSVNGVGVELNTASKQLLSYVSGLNATTAAAIVAHRNENGPFKSRSELKSVPRLGPKAFEQAAGFLRIPRRRRTRSTPAPSIPERYALVEKMAADLGVTVSAISSRDESLARVENQTGELRHRPTSALPTLTDIVAELAKPGRDPREKFEVFAFEARRPQTRGPQARHEAPRHRHQRYRVRRVRGHRCPPGTGSSTSASLPTAFVKEPCGRGEARPESFTSRSPRSIFPAQRIALSMRSNPVIGPKTAEYRQSGRLRAQPSAMAVPRPGGGAAPAAHRAPLRP